MIYEMPIHIAITSVNGSYLLHFPLWGHGVDEATGLPPVSTNSFTSLAEAMQQIEKHLMQIDAAGVPA